MRIDLHTHSHCSDGTDAPAELVRRAAAGGLGVLALTDHDTFAGWSEARDEAARVGVTLVPGVEISCRLAGRSVHLLGYLPDPDDPPLADRLARIRTGRTGRLPAILDRLAQHGLELTRGDVAEQAAQATALGRPHVADAMVARGYVASREEAFDRWLAEGRPAYVTKPAPDPAAAVGLVLGAGGVPVLAHPRGRAAATLLTDEVIGELAACGLAGLEVDHPEHDQPTRAGLRRLATELGLLVTGSSDYHGAGRVDLPLGCDLTAPDQFEALLGRAAPQPRP